MDVFDFEEDGLDIEENREEESSFTTAPADIGLSREETGLAGSLQTELVNTAVDEFYRNLSERGLAPSVGRDYSKFEVTSTGVLRLRGFPDIPLTNSRTGEPLALSTIAGYRGGGVAIREGLGLRDWTRSRRQETVEKLRRIAERLENVPLEDLADNAHRVDEILNTISDPPLNLRELRGLDQALQRTRGELVNNLAKLTELDKDIAEENQKLSATNNEGEKERIRERLRNLADERTARLEAAGENREALRSQISRLRETIHRVLNDDTTLAERLRTLFREQGITIVSILTALGLIVGTIVQSVTGGPVDNNAPRRGQGAKEWAKKQLNAIARLLAKLAGKAVAALPGIIGSIVSWLFNLLSKGVGWVAENTWALLIAAGGMTIVATKQYFARRAR